MRPEVEEILVRVADKHCVSAIDVARGRRHPKTVRARYEWLREVKTALGYSYPETAHATGTDHTTVIRAFRVHLEASPPKTDPESSRERQVPRSSTRGGVRAHRAAPR